MWPYLEKDKYILTDVLKDIEMKLSWLIQVNPKSNNKYPSRTHTEEKTDTAKTAMRMEVEIRVMLTQAQEYLESQKLEDAGEDSPLELLEGMWP